jgi:23S rRNA pseudouridine1911/1915/1917 synthase
MVDDETIVEDQDDGDEGGAQHRQFTVAKDVALRLDVYLRGRLKAISRTKLQQLIDLGGVTVNGQHPKASMTMRRGDVIDVILPPRAVRTIEPEDIPLDVLYEDDHLIVVNKHADLLVHPARGNLSGTLINALAYRFQQQARDAGRDFKVHSTRGFQSPQTGDVDGLSSVGAQEFRPGIVHRLDRFTTGCIVVAKSDQAHWGIARQFERRTTLKSYLAVCHGNFDEAGGAIDQPLGKHPTIREAQAVRHDSQSKQALTLFRVREQYKGYSLVELELKTGRTHQIRVHLSWFGLPIVGDILYGGDPVTRADLAQPRAAPGSRRYLTYARGKTDGDKLEAQVAADPDMLMIRPALHAAMLQFVHPITQQTLTFNAPVHEPMATLIRELRAHPIDAPIVKQGAWIDLTQAVPG